MHELTRGRDQGTGGAKVTMNGRTKELADGNFGSLETPFRPSSSCSLSQSLVSDSSVISSLFLVPCHALPYLPTLCLASPWLSDNPTLATTQGRLETDCQPHHTLTRQDKPATKPGTVSPAT